MPSIEEFFASLKTGKEDKPVLLPAGPMIYDSRDVGGLCVMLDRKLSGCMVLLWSKPIDADAAGRVTGNSIGEKFMEILEH